MSEIHESCSTEDWISAENDLEICARYIDSSDPNWREIVLNELLEENREDSPTSPMALSVSDDEYDQDFKESKIKSLRNFRRPFRGRILALHLKTQCTATTNADWKLF